MDFGTKLKDLRVSCGWTQSQLADKLNLSKANISKYESNFVEPNLETLKMIASIFDVTLDYLLGKDLHKFSPTITDNTTTFPVIGEIAAGYDNVVLESWTGATVEIPNSYLKGRKKEDFIVLEVVGNSMFPEYREGDRVLILKQSTLDYSGQVGAVLYNDEYTTLKKVEFIPGEDWIRLVPINPNHEPQRIEGEALEHCRIIGIPKFLLRFFEER